MKIGIIVGSTRPNRISIKIAEWLKSELENISTHDFFMLDLLDYNLPFFGHEDKNQAIERWENDLDSCDAFIFVTPEYNHSITGVLKNALDFGYNQWNEKPAGIVSYGYGANGARAAEHLRTILGALGVMDVKTQILLSLIDDVKNKVFTPRDLHRKNIELILEQVENKIS